MTAIRIFKFDKRKFSANENALLEKLISASKIISQIYLKQKNNKYPGANFYPHDATKEEIAKEAKKNPDILSPYTIVERNKKGKLIAIPYKIRFRKELKRISQILKEAAPLSQDKKFRAYLNSRAKDLLTDNYDKSNILWLETEKSKVGFVIGPFDRYLDKLFFKKRAYMAWVGILDSEETKKAENLKSMILISERKYLPGAKKTRIPTIKVRVEDTVIFSGLIADFIFVGNNLPSSADLYLIKKYGTLFTVFKPTAKLRFEKWMYPIFKKVFTKEIQKNFSKRELYQAHIRSIILHEICHSLMRYEDAAERLEEFFPFFDELYTDILGIKSCGFLMFKDVLSQKEIEALLIMLICRHLYWMHLYSKSPLIVSYATGGAISLNCLFEGEAIEKKKGVFKVNFEKLFIWIERLSHILEYYIAIGTRDEAKEFISKHGSFKLFNKYFKKKLSKISQTM